MKEKWREKYDYVYSFSEGRVGVKRDGLWGFVDLDGREVIECKYDCVDSFSEGRAVVKRDGLWGFVDLEGNESGFPEVKKKIKKVNKYQLFVREYMKV